MITQIAQLLKLLQESEPSNKTIKKRFPHPRNALIFPSRTDLPNVQHCQMKPFVKVQRAMMLQMEEHF